MKTLNLKAKIKKVDKTKPVKPVSLITYQAFDNADFEFDTEKEAQDFTKAALPIIQFAKDYKKFLSSLDSRSVDYYNTEIMSGKDIIAKLKITYTIDVEDISLDNKKLYFHVQVEDISITNIKKSIFTIEGVEFGSELLNDDVYDIAWSDNLVNKVFVKERAEAQKLFNMYKKLDFKEKSGWDLYDFYIRILSGELKI